MTVDDLVKVVDVLTKLLGVLVWPALLAYVLVKFAPAFKEFFASLGPAHAAQSQLGVGAVGG